jgi:TniQ protein
VVFRPRRGEILYSWLARTAGIYDLEPGELMPAEKDGLLDVLVNGNGASALKHLGALTRMPKATLLRMTLRGIRPQWPEHWCVAGPSPSSTSGDQLVPYLQVCPECLTSDIKEEYWLPPL